MSDAEEKLVIACPDCGKRYHVARKSAGKRARCSCGAEFTIPAAKPAPRAVAEAAVRSPAASVAERQTTAPTHCVQHPDVPAAYACACCHALICRTCDFPQPDGSHLCSTCVSGKAELPTWQAAGPAPWASAGGVAENPYASPFTAVQPLRNVWCQQHPEVAAVARCKTCSAPVCGTCDFRFPGGLHLCPTCATNPSRSLSKTRKTMVVWSMLLAGWVTLFLVLLLSGALAEVVMEEAGATLMGSLIMIPGLIGLALACGSLEKRAGNPPIVWVTVVWNGILMAVWIILCILGMMMDGV